VAYRAIAEAFRKSNVTLPSSAALCARRSHKSHQTLDKLMFLQSESRL